MSGASPPAATAPPRDEPLEILGRIVAGRETGVMAVEAGKLRRLFCFDGGRLRFAASNVIEEQLDAALVREHVLTPADRAAAAEAAKAAGVKVVPYLAEAGRVEPATLERVAAGHYDALLRETLTLRDTFSRFDRGTPKLDGEFTVSLSCLPVLLRHTAKHPSSLDAVRVRIGPPNMRPTRTPDADEILADGELDETARWLATRCTGSREIADIVAASPTTPDATLRALRALLLAGVLAPATRDHEVGKGANRVSRDEVVARVDRALEADHYGVLGLERSATADDVRSAYYYLARRYHPDRFRAGPLESLLPRIEEYFAKVTEAYNTLIDAERRSAYDKELELKATAGESEEETLDSRFIAKQNFLRAKALIGKRQFQAALPFLENAIEQDDSQAPYFLELGRVLTRAPRRRDEAEAALQRAAGMNPADVEIYLALGELYRLKQRPDEAVRAYQEALRWKPNDAEARAALVELGVGESDGGGLFGGLFKGKT